MNAQEIIDSVDTQQWGAEEWMAYFYRNKTLTKLGEKFNGNN